MVSKTIENAAVLDTLLQFKDETNGESSSISQEIIFVADHLETSYLQSEQKYNLKFKPNPTVAGVSDIIHTFMSIIFPEPTNKEISHKSVAKIVLVRQLDHFVRKLIEQISLAYISVLDSSGISKRLFEVKLQAEEDAVMVLNHIKEFRTILLDDVDAAFEGDPAAVNYNEIILSYPFIKAVTIHQLAHFLYKLKVPIIPRMLSEWVHSETGIDIHPGATIGKRFFIDHGTGVVIGETTEIGDNVRIYQGVTLGALSFQRNQDGNIVKGTKRHPTLRDNVVVYANATILGGDTVIGENSVIGGNAWVTQSVDDNTLVTIEAKMQLKKRIRS